MFSPAPLRSLLESFLAAVLSVVKKAGVLITHRNLTN